MQTLSLKRKLTGVKLVGFFSFLTRKTYTSKYKLKEAEKQHNFKQIAKDCVNVERAAILSVKINEAKEAIAKGWSFAKYCFLCSLYSLRSKLFVGMDKLSRAMLF